MRFTKAEAAMWEEATNRRLMKAENYEEEMFFHYWNDALWDYINRFAGGRYL